MPDADRRCPQCGEPYAPAGHPMPCPRCGTVLPPRLPPPPAPPGPLDIETWFQEPPVPKPAAQPAGEPLDLKPPALPAGEPSALSPPPPAVGDEFILLDDPLDDLPPTSPPPTAGYVPVVRPVSRPSAGPPLARTAPSAPTPARVTDLPEARPAPPDRLPPRRESRAGPLVRPPLPPVRTDGPPDVPKPRVIFALVVLLGVLVAGACAVTVVAYALWAGFKTVSRPKPETPPVPVVAPGPPARR